MRTGSSGLWMFSAIIATHDSERPLVHTLSALVPGATVGLVREVIVADGQSTDETEQVADYAGCVFFSSGESLGGRLKAAAQSARGEWLMFLRPGAVPGPTWIDNAVTFVQQGMAGAAVFRGQAPGLLARLFKPLPHPDQGLIVPKSLYIEIGGHRADASDPEADLLSRIGRSRLTVLRTTVTRSDN
jgi:glycosyltransferase involved in cell wall biosynthesis